MEQVLIFFGCPLLIHRHIHTHTHIHKHSVFPILDGKQIHVKYCSQTVCKQFANSLQTVCKQFANCLETMFANCLQTVCEQFANCSQTVCKHCFQTMFPGVDRLLLIRSRPERREKGVGLNTSSPYAFWLLFVTFIDFSKAYDLVNRDVLFNVLKQQRCGKVVGLEGGSLT